MEYNLFELPINWSFSQQYDLIILNIIVAQALYPTRFEQFPSNFMGLEWEWLLNSKQQNTKKYYLWLKMWKCKKKAIVKAQGTCIIIFVEVNYVNDFLHIERFIQFLLRKYENMKMSLISVLPLCREFTNKPRTSQNGSRYVVVHGCVSVGVYPKIEKCIHVVLGTSFQ